MTRVATWLSQGGYERATRRPLIAASGMGGQSNNRIAQGERQ